MRAEAVFREKRILEQMGTNALAIAELRIWRIPRSKDYPAGRKFSLFLVLNGKVLVGIDNHKPKGPHVHLADEEIAYDYQGDEKLLQDFWRLAREAGFKT